MPGVVLARRRPIRTDMHAVPFDAFQQIDMHKSTGPGLERIEHGLVHRNIALDILDPPSRNGARGKERMPDRLDFRQRALAGGAIGKVGGDVDERRPVGWRMALHAVNAPTGVTRPALQRSDRGSDRSHVRPVRAFSFPLGNSSAPIILTHFLCTDRTRFVRKRYGARTISDCDLRGNRATCS